MKRKASSSYRYLYSIHLSDATKEEEQQILGFIPMNRNGEQVVKYLKTQAFADEDIGTMRTYIVKDKNTEEIVAFFSLKSGLVSLNETDPTTFDTLPGVEMALFAVNKAYKDAHPEVTELGLTTYRRLVIPVIMKARVHTGIKIVYIFALPYEKLLKNYRDYGFRPLPEEDAGLLYARLKPRFDRSCVFMYQIL